MPEYFTLHVRKKGIFVALGIILLIAISFLFFSNRKFISLFQGEEEPCQSLYSTESCENRSDCKLYSSKNFYATGMSLSACHTTEIADELERIDNTDCRSIADKERCTQKMNYKCVWGLDRENIEYHAIPRDDGTILHEIVPGSQQHRCIPNDGDRPF